MPERSPVSTSVSLKSNGKTPPATRSLDGTKLTCVNDSVAALGGRLHRRVPMSRQSRGGDDQRCESCGSPEFHVKPPSECSLDEVK